ncbi:P-loop NTPase fold protein [Fusicatenibacter saccharivorans]|uniref:P-loop NTPase fold protein n=2 Tax=Fusicatenibacter saccharivorans TaxID=1150298 RepID=UPI0034A5B044
MTEQQIKEEILRYIKDRTYNYAVLIDGEWGSEKTYFVKRIIVPSINEQEKFSGTDRAVKYISLYGCKNIGDVQENIAWSFAENARQKIKNKASWGNSADKISENAFLSSRKIGNAILEKFLPKDLLYQIASDWLNLGEFIFIFDDLERCECPINELFGFLNELIEHENTKVIIIANEKEVSGIAEVQNLEGQYYLSLDERIEWPKQENYFSRIYPQNCNSQKLTFDEIERRRKMLFPVKEANSNYRRIREKLIGVNLKYEPDIDVSISEIIKSSNCDNFTKMRLEKNVKLFISTMENYNHKNLRTFQFFLSKVNYLLEKLTSVEIEDEYRDAVSSHVISETFVQSVEYKANYHPARDSHVRLSIEQDTKFQSIKLYIECGIYNQKDFQQDIWKLQVELAAKIPEDDPYYLIYQQYYFHTQAWCEEQLEKVLQRLEKNKYPISFYEKIIVSIQRLNDLGFDIKYMDQAKKLMLTNIESMGEVTEIGSDLWYIHDLEDKEKVSTIINEINNAIKQHSEITSRETVSDILLHDDWVERLNHYVNPKKSLYIQDMLIFSKAEPKQWLNALHRASPKDIDAFRNILNDMYPSGVKRESYNEDAQNIKTILKGLDGLKEEDLIKKACLGWLKNQIKDIVDLHESKIQKGI